MILLQRRPKRHLANSTLPLLPHRQRQGKKGERIQEKRVEQKQFMKSVVQRVLGEFIDAGRLGKTELDDAAKEVLEKMEAKVSGYHFIDARRLGHSQRIAADFCVA